MSEQPEALRLADWCDAHSSGIYRPSAEAAAELRRLHALCEEMGDALWELVQDTQHKNHECGDNECPVKKAKAALAKWKESK